MYQDAYKSMETMKRAITFLLILTIFLSAIVPVHASTGDSPSLDGIQIFPEDHIWNVPVDTLPVDSRSDVYINSINRSTYLRADFGAGGIPYNIVNNTQETHYVTFIRPDISEEVPYPIPDNPLMERGGSTLPFPENCTGDCHVLIVNQDSHFLYELYDAERFPNGTWGAYSGAVYNLSGYQLRPTGWGSADAAGLAILPGLIKYDEVNAGEINHAIRFALVKTNKSKVWPAISYSSAYSDGTNPPFGQRLRLNASFNTSGYPNQTRVILNALKKYGMILADNGPKDIAISGTPDSRWINADLWALRTVNASNFEAVDCSSLMISMDSGLTRKHPALTVQVAGTIVSSDFAVPFLIVIAALGFLIMIIRKK
jgi:hypothetical protein